MALLRRVFPVLKREKDKSILVIPNSKCEQRKRDSGVGRNQIESLINSARFMLCNKICSLQVSI